MSRFRIAHATTQRLLCVALWCLLLGGLLGMHGLGTHDTGSLDATPTPAPTLTLDAKRCCRTSIAAARSPGARHAAAGAGSPAPVGA